MATRKARLVACLRAHAQSLRRAWHDRQRRAELARIPPERLFLPAALRLQETPVHPAPRVAMWLLIAFALLALLWALVGEIDVVATAQGKVVANGRTKTIQPATTATVKRILVTDGQQVKTGDLLIELDATEAQADSLRLQGELAAARLEAERGQAMQAALASGALPELQKPEQASELQFEEAQRLLNARFAEYQAKQNRIDAEISRREAEARSTQALVTKLEQTVPIARRRAQDYKDLVERNFVSKHGYLEREQARIEQEADLNNQKSRLKEIEASLREARSQRQELIAETRRTAHDNIAEGQQKAAAIEQEHVKAAARGKLMQLTAPVDGTVQQLAVHTVGGVVTPAQALMMIVPADEAMEVEAFVENKDIGFVSPGQEAQVKFETFRYTKYGTVPAKVVSVSHDAISDEKRGLVYSMRLMMSRARMMVDGTEVKLGPGMAVAVEVKTGRRKVIEYLLSPVMQHGSEGLRER